MLKRIGVNADEWRWVALAVVVAIAAVARFYRLDTLPSGLHGDEAFWGLLAQRVTDEGWIGPYTRGVAGAPTGTTYLMAPAIALFGNTIFAVRVVSALAGTLTVLVLYLVGRQHVGERVALVGALLLATLGWHLHFSRTGFPIVWWPLLTLLAAHAAVLAVTRDDLRWWAVCGGLLAAGLYVYNAQPLYGALVGLFLLLGILHRRAFRGGLRGAAVATIAGLVVLLPMLVYAFDRENEYFEHFQDASITEQDAWRERDNIVEKISLIGERYVDHWEYLIETTKVDHVDGTGLVPLVPRLFLYLAASGMVMTLLLRRRRSPFLLLGLLVVLLLPISSATTEGGMIRRSFAAAPFLALFAGVTIDELLRVARRLSGWRGIAVAGLAVIALLGTVTASLQLYFDDFADRGVQRRVLADDMTDATQFMLTLPDDAYIYFYSDRFSFTYTIRRFLAPDVRGENRSDEFDTYSTDFAPGRGRPVFILLGDYRDDLSSIQERYPGGEVYVGTPRANPTFVAYVMGRAASSPILSPESPPRQVTAARAARAP
jgi:4-amino-4-deoxy-L-arabinose transferase-like glycosyltransferase